MKITLMSVKMDKNKGNRNRSSLLMASILALILAAFCVSADYPPAVTLISPGDDYGTEEEDLTVTFKQVDDVSLTCSCSLYLDGSLIQTNPSVSNNTPTSFTITGITAGTHYWTVKCTDGGGNTGSPYYVIFGADHLYQSNDDGQNWQQLGEGYLKPSLFIGGYWNIYALDSTSYGRLFISFRYGNYYTCEGFSSAVAWLHESTFKRNSESNIMQIIDGNCLNRNFRKIYSVVEASNGDLYAASGGIFRSVDKGAFWSPVPGPAGVYSMTVASNGHIFASSTSGVYRSTDDGQSFSLLPGSPTTSEYQHTGSFITSTGNDVYVASDKSVWKSDDDGNSWNNVFTVSGGWSAILSLYAYGGDHIFAGIRQDDETLGAIYRSIDAGVSWQPVLMQQQIRDETGSEEGWVQAIDRVPVGDIYASVEGHLNGKGLLYRSNDSGDSWELLLDESRPPSGGPVLVDGVENVHRSFTVPTWPHVGRYISHKSSTSIVGNMSVAYEKWNRDLGLDEPWSGAVTADVTGNGGDEIALVSDRLYLLDGEGNTLWGKMCCLNCIPNQPCDGAWNNGQIPAIGDVDGDGLAEIVSRGYGNELICRDAITGSLEWFISVVTLDLGWGSAVTPVIADVTGDGLAEIIVHGNKLYVLNGSDGSVLWSKNIRTEDTVPAVGDLDGDGLLDIVVKEDGGALLHAFDGAGNKLWESTVQTDYNLVTGYITIADVEGDDRPEVIEVCWGELFVFNGEDGSILWSKPYDEFDGQEAVNYRGSPAVGDLDGDGRMEIILGLSGRDTHPAQGLYVLNGECGSILWRNLSIGPVYGAPAVADIDRDGGLEVVVQTDKVYAFNADGTLLWEYPIGGRSNIALADVDWDDYVEVIAVSGGRVYVLDGTYVPLILKNVTLNYSVTDDHPLIKCSLWTNVSANWQIDQTNTTIVNGGVNSFRIINVALGIYKWNVQCFDDIGQYAFAFQNWTFTVA
jgi:hypothetical protein